MISKEELRSWLGDESFRPLIDDSPKHGTQVFIKVPKDEEFIYEDCNAVRVYTEIENISSEPIVLEEASAFVCGGLGENGIDSASDLYFTCFIQSHHGVF